MLPTGRSASTAHGQARLREGQGMRKAGSASKLTTLPAAQKVQLLRRLNPRSFSHSAHAHVVVCASPIDGPSKSSVCSSSTRWAARGLRETTPAPMRPWSKAVRAEAVLLQSGKQCRTMGFVTRNRGPDRRASAATSSLDILAKRGQHPSSKGAARQPTDVD